MSAVIPDNVRAIFFDAVGTLLFPEPSAPDIYAVIAAKQGLSLSPTVVMSRFLRAHQAEEAADRFTGWVTSEEREVVRWRQIVYKTLNGVNDPETCFRQLFDHFSKPSAWRIDPFAETLFANLIDRGYKLGIGSNYDARLRSVLNGSPSLAPLHERVVVSAQLGFRKPAGEFFQEIARVAECSPSEVLFVGDDIENDYEGARKSGLHAVLLAPRANRPNVKDVIGDLRQLLE